MHPFPGVKWRISRLCLAGISKNLILHISPEGFCIGKSTIQYVLTNEQYKSTHLLSALLDNKSSFTFILNNKTFMTPLQKLPSFHTGK